MAAVRAEQFAPVASTLATTLRRINPGDGVVVVWFQCTADCYLVYGDDLDDGDALPAGYLRIPANIVWPIRVGPVRPHVAAVTGTPVATFLGEGP